MAVYLSLEDLPPELFSDIAASFPLHATSTALLSLTLVNHAFYDVFYPLLYSQVILRNEKDTQRTLFKFFMKPEVGQYVKGLHIMSDFSRETRYADRTNLLVSDTITGLKNLLSNGILPNLGALSLHLQTGWRSYQPKGFGKLPATFWRNLVRNCPRIKSIVLSGLEDIGLSPWILESGIYEFRDFKNLNKIGLSFFPSYSGKEGLKIMSTNLSTLSSSLHTLSLDFGFHVEAPISSLHFPNLRSLTLSSFQAVDTSEAMSFWSRHQKLERLNISSSKTGSSWFEDNVPVGFLPALKYLEANYKDVLSLASILSQLARLCVWRSSEADVPHLLRDVLASGLPGLRSLEVEVLLLQSGSSSSPEFRANLTQYFQIITTGAPNLEEIGIHSRIMSAAVFFDILCDDAVCGFDHLERIYVSYLDGEYCYWAEKHRRCFFDGAFKLAQKGKFRKLRSMTNFSSSYKSPYPMAVLTKSEDGSLAFLDAGEGFGMEVGYEGHPFPGVPGSGALFASILVIVASISSFGITLDWRARGSVKVPINAAQIVQKCQSLHLLPGPPDHFHQREYSDRYVAGTPPTLLRNASIWTGRDSGNEVVVGDILIDKGLIKEIGTIKKSALKDYKSLIVVDAGGAWITPGIVDLHSHLGVSSSPSLKGSSDGNSHKGPILPWLRALDGLNTHDEAYRLSISGGVTTANVLPGSANAIGGQAFTIKLRPTAERSSSAMVLEPPFELNGSQVDISVRPRWRQMKHACGENPSRVYSNTRMDTIWAFREGYNTARKIKEKQDDYCVKALNGEWKDLGEFPDDLQWEALVDVLRGRVKIHNHCYEGVDLDGIVRLTNEFKFSIAAFHHAHETYLVPDLLKKAYGHPPAIALFATNARYKREAYRGSEFAPRILAENGLKVVMKSDHPVLDSRFLLHEAQQAHYFGLPHNLSLASVTSTPATVLGYDHRIGFIKPGYDADIVIWDSHPLALGATPAQVFIDGIPQLDKPHTNPKPSSSQHVPQTPDFSQEAKDAVKYDGLPPLEPNKSVHNTVVFTNVSSVLLREGANFEEAFSIAQTGEPGVVVVERGRITCVGALLDCPMSAARVGTGNGIKKVDLEGGSISPALISFGSHLALNHIDGEASTNDGPVHDPLVSDTPSILGEGSVIRAVDGLQFSTRDALLAYRSGVTVGVTAPTSSGLINGLGVAFDTGSPHKLSKGAVLQEVTALHVTVGSSTTSVSTQIGVLRSLLDGEGKGQLGASFERVVKGEIPFVIQVQNADIMGSLINLKTEVEKSTGTSIKMTFAGANEAYLVAKEIGEAGVGVILRPSRPFPKDWKSRRILPGPPLTKDNSFSILRAHNVTVGVGVLEQWSSRNIRLDIAWAALDTVGGISKPDAIALASTNLERLLGIQSHDADLVAVKHGDLLDFEGKVAGIISPRREVVDLLL